MHADMWVPADFDTRNVEETRKYPKVYGPMIDLGLMTPQQAATLEQWAHLDVRELAFGNVLLRNLGAGTFLEVSDKAGAETFQPWGAVPADFRNAGAEDVFIPSGMGNPFFYWRNNYLLNRGDGTFLECAKAAGFDPPPGGEFLTEKIKGKSPAKSSRAGATADFDGDGRLDLVVNNFNERAYLYMNRSPARNWVELRLTGTKSNRDAIGALVTIRAGGRTQVRQVQTAGGYLSQSSKTLHFGLGDATVIEGCEIRWPSGVRQTIEALGTNRLHDVTEGIGRTR
jgi:hypothetical protein